MDAKSYCDSVRIELTQWKAKLYDVIRKTESLSADHSHKVKPTVEELNSIVDDLNGRIVYLGYFALNVIFLIAPFHRTFTG